MSNLVAILALVAFLQAKGITCTTNIFKIDIVTADGTNDGTDSTIIMKICNDNDCCNTWLDNTNKNDFQRGALDIFGTGTSFFHNYLIDYCEKVFLEEDAASSVWDGSKWDAAENAEDCKSRVEDLTNCDAFNITVSEPSVTMQIIGNDKWVGESVKITLFNGTTFEYTITQEIDGDGSQSETDAVFQSTYDITEPHAIANVKVKTSNADHANTDDPIFMKICRGNVYDCCYTQLDNPSKNDFEKDKTNTFEPSILNECETFEIKSTPDVYMSIEGNDGWLGESVVIEMTTGEIYKCEIDAWIDGNGKGKITTTTVPTCKKE